MNYKFAMSNVFNFQKGTIPLKESVLEFAFCKNSIFSEFYLKKW